MTERQVPSDTSIIDKMTDEELQHLLIDARLIRQQAERTERYIEGRLTPMPTEDEMRAQADAFGVDGDHYIAARKAMFGGDDDKEE